jgi:hypothetical protein
MKNSTPRTPARQARYGGRRGRVQEEEKREQLVNNGDIGSITEVSLMEPRITSLLGILLDIDPNLFKKCRLTRAQRSDPVHFYEAIIRPMLVRHPVLSKAEVRMSGRGLHVIVRFAAPIEFETETQRTWWSLAVKCVQRLLPTDPDVPGITATTRPIGSVNTKNGKKVLLLKAAEPITRDEVQRLVKELSAAPVRTIAGVLFGGEKITPCPICVGKDSSLVAFDRFAKCYACGNVKLDQLYDIFLGDRPKRKGA